MRPTFIRRGFTAALVAVAATLVACSDTKSVPVLGGSPTPSGSASATPTAKPTPTATPTIAAVQYTAVGASDAVGYNASVPCANPPTVAVPTCPGGTGYVPLLGASYAKAKGASLVLDDLGISGAVLGPDIKTLTNMYASASGATPCQPRTAADAVPADFITNELPNVPATATFVTVFAGGNDTNGIVNALACGAGGTTTASQTAFITTWITNFGNDFESLVAQIHSKAPNAYIVVANLPNFSQIPIGIEISQTNPTAGQALAAVSVGIDQNVINKATAFGVPVVDLLCNAASYLKSNFYPGPLADGFHPNDAGYAAFAAAFLAQSTTATPTPPVATCSYATATSRLRSPVAIPIRAFEHR